jgi:hypothetical protein
VAAERLDDDGVSQRPAQRRGERRRTDAVDADGLGGRKACRGPQPGTGQTLRTSSKGVLAGVNRGAMRLRSRTVKVIRQPGGPAPVALAMAGSAGCGGGGVPSGE